MKVIVTRIITGPDDMSTALRADGMAHAVASIVGIFVSLISKLLEIPNPFIAGITGGAVTCVYLSFWILRKIKNKIYEEENLNIRTEMAVEFSSILSDVSNFFKFPLNPLGEISFSCHFGGW